MDTHVYVLMCVRECGREKESNLFWEHSTTRADALCIDSKVIRHNVRIVHLINESQYHLLTVRECRYLKHRLNINLRKKYVLFFLKENFTSSTTGFQEYEDLNNSDNLDKTNNSMITWIYKKKCFIFSNILNKYM